MQNSRTYMKNYVNISFSVIETEDYECLKRLQYNQFIEALDNKDIEKMTIQPENNVYLVNGKLKDQNDHESFSTVIPYNASQDLDSILETAKEDKDLTFNVEPAEEQSPWT